MFLPAWFRSQVKQCSAKLARAAAVLLPNLLHFESNNRYSRLCCAARMVLLHIKVRWPQQRCPELEASRLLSCRKQRTNSFYAKFLWQQRSQTRLKNSWNCKIFARAYTGETLRQLALSVQGSQRTLVCTQLALFTVCI